MYVYCDKRPSNAAQETSLESQISPLEVEAAAKPMKISVLLPIYRTNEKFLREALESVLKQSFADFELLLLDDCPENTREAVVREFADERIVYLKNETNLGIAGSRNKLVSRAKGEYIAVLDHDDIALPTRFEEQVKFLDANPEVGVVGSWTEEFPRKRTIRWPQAHEAIVARLTQGCAIPHTASMIRRAVLKDVKYENEFFPAEDYALWYRLIGKTKFYNLPKVLTRYRRHKRNTSIVASDKMRKATKKIRKLFATSYPEFLNLVKTRAKYVVRMKLFGLIPIGKFTQVGEKRRGILKFLPFVACKAKLAEAI